MDIVDVFNRGQSKSAPDKPLLEAAQKLEATWCDCGGRSPVANEVLL